MQADVQRGEKEERISVAALSRCQDTQPHHRLIQTRVIVKGHLCGNVCHDLLGSWLGHLRQVGLVFRQGVDFVAVEGGPEVNVIDEGDYGVPCVDGAEEAYGAENVFVLFERESCQNGEGWAYIGKRKIITFAFHFRFFHFKTFSGKVEK